MTEETFNRLRELFENCPEVAELVAEVKRYRERIKGARKVWADKEEVDDPQHRDLISTSEPWEDCDRHYHLLPVEEGD